ncbi:MAG: energy-coupling factor transporter transmembrane component T [Roseovarius sp.]
MISLTSPVRTWAHGWPAGLKLAGLCAATLVLFFIESVPAHLAIFGAVLGVYALPGRVFLATGMRRLRLLWPFILVVMLWHLWEGSVAQGVAICLRLLSAVALANLVTMTTRLTDMIAVIRWLAAPLRRVGLETRALELAVALTIRMTPVLAEKGELLSASWRARARRRAGWRILLPFTLLALDDADHVAEALKARGGLGN